MRITTQAARGRFWSEWLTAHLPVEMRPRVSAVVEREGTLVIFAESAAWSARLRYTIQELEPGIRAAAQGITSVVVRVRPRD